MFEIPEIMKTESFLSLIIGGGVLLLMITLILIDRFRRPEIYSKKQSSEKETKTQKRNISDNAV